MGREGGGEGEKKEVEEVMGEVCRGRMELGRGWGADKVGEEGRGLKRLWDGVVGEMRVG